LLKESQEEQSVLEKLRERGEIMTVWYLQPFV